MYEPESKKKISFVIPCYHSAQTLPSVVREVCDTMDKLPQYTFEIVLVNDCSPDDTWDAIKSLIAAFPQAHITGINLAKNFGQHAALMAGFRTIRGDILVCLDDDGQTPADEVGKLLEKIEEGDDVVYAKYDHKQHSKFRNWGSRLNDKMTCALLGKPKDLYVSSYFAAKRYIVDEMVRYKNAYPYVIGLVLRTTKKISNVEVDHRERKVGESGYTISKLFALWMNGFTAFSIKPLRVATVTGCICAGAGFIYGIYTIVKKCINPLVPVGFSALITAIVFIGGMMMLMMGLVGEYIGRMYISMNDSPQYVIRDMEGENTMHDGSTDDSRGSLL